MIKSLYDRTVRVEKDGDEMDKGPGSEPNGLGGVDEQPLVSAIAAEYDKTRAPSTLIGMCMDNHHPSLSGRCLIRWTDASKKPQEKWLPCIRDVKPQRHDRVLLQQPGNWFEPLVCGILDGLAGPEDHTPKTGPAIRLEKNKAIHVVDSGDNPVLQIEQGEHGPVLRLLNDDLNIEVKGRLRFSAKDIQMAARRGEIRIKAKDDVHVKGEMIHLN